MSINLNEAIGRIRKAGATKVRCLPMPGQNVQTGNYRIEVDEGQGWQTIVEGIPKSSAEDLVQTATNRLLLG